VPLLLLLSCRLATLLHRRLLLLRPLLPLRAVVEVVASPVAACTMSTLPVVWTSTLAHRYDGGLYSFSSCNPTWLVSFWRCNSTVKIDSG